MPTLQKTFTYAGNAAAAPLDTVSIEFEIPQFQYSVSSSAEIETVVRSIAGVETFEIPHAIVAPDYSVLFTETFALGKDAETAARFARYFWDSLRQNNIANFTVQAKVRFLSDTAGTLGEQSLEFVHFPKLEAAELQSRQPVFMAAALPRTEAMPFDPSVRRFIAINRGAFVKLHQLLTATFGPIDQSVLMLVISALTDAKPEGPGEQPLTPEQKQLLYSLMGVSGDQGKKILDAIRKALPALFDFPLTLRELKTLTIAGKLTIAGLTRPATAQDFQAYSLSAEIRSVGTAESRVLRYAFAAGLEVEDGKSTRFTVPTPAILRNAIASPVSVRLTGSGESAQWSKDFDVDDPTLANLDIRVLVAAPIVLSTTPTSVPPGPKKLRGQVLEFSAKCPLKGLTVVIQVKDKQDDEMWRIVGAATTDASGNFSIPYPFGVFAEAQALVSAAPDSPAAVRITDAREGNQTIADDFLYLLVKEMKCHDGKHEKDCDCHGKKPSRLPDQADLIQSDEYTQDIGGSCVNLSTPNRTISELDYQAVVRISDPEVASYVLKKSNTVVLAGIDPVLFLDISRARAALETAIGNPVFRASITEAVFSRVSARSTALHAITAGSSGADVAAAINSVDAIIADVGAAAASGTLAGVAADAGGQTGEDAAAALLAALTASTFGLPASGSGSANAPASANSPQRDNTAAGFEFVLGIAGELKSHLKAVLLPRVETEYELVDNRLMKLLAEAKAARFGYRSPTPVGSGTYERRPVGLDNPVKWQDDDQHLSLYQAVSVATGHILHYKAEFKADGYSLGDLLYSLPLAPGQKKQIVVFDSSHRLSGEETQGLSQAERLAAGITEERTITDVLGGRIAESLQGSSFASTRGISAGFGTGGQGSGSSGMYGGSGSAVLGVAGGAADANATADQNSSRDVSQHFDETLRHSILQNADSYRQLNASVVTTVQEGQRYAVTSEVVANHNHCHALTIMYFEVLRHFAVFQRLSSVEECVFVPLLMTNFTAHNIHKWRDVLARFLLPMPAETYLQPFSFTPDSPRQHPLLKAFDANERIKTHYANVDYPEGSYDDERIQFVKGTMRLRVNLPRPRTRFDRILSLPITRQLDAKALAAASQDFAIDSATYAAKAAVTAGFYTLFEKPPAPPNPAQFEVLARREIFDACMTLDANFSSVPPAECIRVTNFKPPATITVGGIDLGLAIPAQDFFAENSDDRNQWKIYAELLGYPDVFTMLNAYFKGNLISEWDTIFYTDIAPRVLDKIVSSISLSEFATDFSGDTRYKGGERSITLNVTGTTSKKRNQLPSRLRLDVSSDKVKSLGGYVTLDVENLTLSYSTAHYNGLLYSGNVNDDLLDGADLYIPESAQDKRNPRKEDTHLAYKLLEHLNSNLEYYNRALWYNLDPERRFMLLDGFSIQTFNARGGTTDAQGNPLPPRSLASVVKNELVTVTGNSLVFPVAPGYKVNQFYVSEDLPPAPIDATQKRKLTLLDHYQPLTPVEPYRISVPSRGVFAEAVMGACNACEKIETDRLQDWNRFPNTDEPTAIAPVVAPTPGVTDWKAAFKDFAPPMVNIQNAPGATEPGAGLAGLTELLGKAGVFKDITGLDATQQNAIRTYLSNQENAKAFAEMAKEMAMQTHNTQNSDRIMGSISQAKNSGDITSHEAGQLTRDHLQQQIDGGITKKAELVQSRQASPTALTKAVVDAAGQGRRVTAQTTDEGGSESVSIDAGENEEVSEDVLAEATGVPGVAQPNGNTCWAAVATMMCMWRDPIRYQSIDDVMTDAGDKFVQLYNKGRGQGRRLPAADKSEFLTALQMVSEPSGTNYPLQSYIDWLGTYGPLWISIDADPDPDDFSAHAIVVTRISGSGTPDGQGTDVTYIDPMGAKPVTAPFNEFIASYEALGKPRQDLPPSVQATLVPAIQVVHFMDAAGDDGEGGGPGKGGAAGAAAAVGEKVLDKTADMVGDYIEMQMAAGGGTTELPSDVTFMLSGTKPDDYKTIGPQQDNVRRCRITFDNLVATGPGEGLDGYVILEWLSTRYRGAISSRTPSAIRQYLKAIQFAKNITGRGTLYVGGALGSVDVAISLFPMTIEDQTQVALAGPFLPVMARIKIVAKAKTATGDSITSTVVVALHPDNPVNYKLSYVKTPHRDIKAEVDETP
jgi:hypothetical protein